MQPIGPPHVSLERQATTGGHAHARTDGARQNHAFGCSQVPLQQTGAQRAAFCQCSPFSVDEINPAHAGMLADYKWVHNPLAKHPTRCVPYLGSGWCGRAASQCMLAHGIITWIHIGLVFEASMHLPAKYLSEQLMALEQIWQGCTDKGISKRGTLAMLGLWGQTQAGVPPLLHHGHRRCALDRRARNAPHARQ